MIIYIYIYILYVKNGCPGRPWCGSAFRTARRKLLLCLERGSRAEAPGSLPEGCFVEFSDVQGCDGIQTHQDSQRDASKG